MSQLLRIILIHTHLPGVIELDLQGHANICGTNASGKTTLQRLIPVFFGEQPNRVVPKTRDRFDVFYLPFQNSYLIYEYQRADGSQAQVVLTKRNDGVDYRFVDAPYEPTQYLEETADGTKGLGYHAWAQRLRALEIESSHKISATSEYRAIIQNDLSAMRNNRKDQLKLRQLAARYGLVSGSHRLRHIEKLVSAVHAKEGKMDTLKSMLATILEEDGYQRPENTFKPAKIKAWIKEMRQFMQMDNLQAYYAEIEQCLADTAASKSQLWQLKPLVEQDRSQLLTQTADVEAQLATLHKQQDELDTSYRAQKRELDDARSETESRYQQVQRDLELAQSKRDRYLDSGIEDVAQDSKELPAWQQKLEEQTRHLQLMLEKNADIAQQLDQRKSELSEVLDRLQRKNQQRCDELRAEQGQIRSTQDETLARLQQQTTQQVEQMQLDLHDALQRLQHEQVSLETQLSIAPLGADEREHMQLADARIEDAQQALETATDRLAREDDTVQQRRTQREQADRELTQCRQQLHQAKARCKQLQAQVNPEHGSLRQALREHKPDWEQNLGKVLCEDLLQRTDLSPRFAAGDDSLYGLLLDLSAVESPHFALGEAQLETELQTAGDAAATAEQQCELAESALSKAHQACKDAEQVAQQARQAQRRCQQDLEYARDGKKRLQAEQDAVIKERQQSNRKRLKVLQDEEQKTRESHQQRLQQMRHDAKALELEHKADFQEQLSKLDDDISQYARQVDDMRSVHAQQVKELQARVSDELAEAGVDSKKLQALKAETETLRERIASTKERQHELSEYDDFMRSTWNRLRPGWMEQEQQLKSTLTRLDSELTELKQQTKLQRKTLEQEDKRGKEQLHQQQSLNKELDNALARFNELTQHRDFAEPVSAATESSFGDTRERLQRMLEALNSYAHSSRKLREQCERFSTTLRRDASADFEHMIEREFATLSDTDNVQEHARVLGELLNILQDQQSQIVEQGRNIGGGLQSFFKVFDDINRRVSQYSRRLTDAVGDELVLEGISRSEVHISSTIDELNFWQPLKELSQLFQQWSESGQRLPPEAYLDRLADVAELLRADQDYSLESLLKLELYLNESGSELIIRNDRQLLESSSHGMAYLILCKFLLAFTRLLRGDSAVTIHWPIDEIGTLAYHNVEKLFQACDSNAIQVVGAFPNPESDVLLLFRHRYLIEPHPELQGKGQLKRIQPRQSPLSAKLEATLADQHVMETSE